ncbi:DUF4252 domain-containing protein [Lutibacter sp. A64]|uniref:DUF4252 domain-containing protein n=1 Tax=Lutibacter sp. A64 TaxID=2918526 RepID=UPI001F0660D7|nr:DUF4252 domain-containing protein [Lutibacter sp. A64]UMB54576.1 DUF4252 domain-containing protein [Lutibacter sp. A64]
MNSAIKFFGILFFVMFAFISCNNSPTLQEYYVTSKENDAFISVDLPANILQLKNNEVSEDVKQTLASIKKVNFLALQLTDSNEALYTSEKLKVKAILKNPKYKQLMRMNLGKGAVSVNYLGEEDAIDEVVLFGSDNNKGFAVVRVLGENMNPAEIMKMAQEIELDGDSEQLKQLGGLINGLK